MCRLRLADQAIGGERPAVRHDVADLDFRVVRPGVVFLLSGGGVREHRHKPQDEARRETAECHAFLPGEWSAWRRCRDDGDRCGLESRPARARRPRAVVYYARSCCTTARQAGRDGELPVMVGRTSGGSREPLKVARRSGPDRQGTTCDRDRPPRDGRVSFPRRRYHRRTLWQGCDDPPVAREFSTAGAPSRTARDRILASHFRQKPAFLRRTP